MKKARKFLAVLLAVLVVFSSFAVALSASAATQNDAQAAVDAYVKGSAKYPVLVRKSTVLKQERNLNKSLASIIESKDVKSQIYTNDTVGSLMKTIYGALSEVGGGMLSFGPKDVSSYVSNKAVAKVLRKAKTWDDVDPAALEWGFETGDREGFEAALTDGLSAALVTVLQLLSDRWDTVFVALFESLHVETVSSDKLAELYAVAENTGDLIPFANIVVKPLLDFIDNLLAAPVDTLCDVLPDFANNWGGIAESINTSFLGLFGLKVPADITELLNGLIKDTGIVLPAIDLAYVATLGNASAVESATAGGYRMAIAGDKADVYMTVMNYLKKTVDYGDNKVAVGRLITKAIGEGYVDNYDEIVAAAHSGNVQDFMNKVLDLADEVADNLAGDSVIGGVFGAIYKGLNKVIRVVIDIIAKILNIF